MQGWLRINVMFALEIGMAFKLWRLKKSKSHGEKGVGEIPTNGCCDDS